MLQHLKPGRYITTGSPNASSNSSNLPDSSTPQSRSVQTSTVLPPLSSRNNDIPDVTEDLQNLLSTSEAPSSPDPIDLFSRQSFSAVTGFISSVQDTLPGNESGFLLPSTDPSNWKEAIKDVWIEHAGKKLLT